ncbi:MAG: hypothetical protein NTZ87_01475 [Candidatus Nomurabacteria bacterium]|nr:hypothetical protein [Candidatus Nomurabacteria bacterium]
MIADKIFEWLKIKFKFNKYDVLIVFVLSVIISGLVYYTSYTSFYDLGNSNQLIQYVNYCLELPIAITGLVLYLLQFGSHGDSEGLGFLIFFISPIISFIFWFFIFSIVAKIISKLFKSKNLILKHGLSIIFIIFLIFPYLYYSFGTNEMDACLSGKFNRVYHATLGDVPQGPLECFGRIANKDLGSTKNNPSAVLKYCNKLSNSKIVPMGNTEPPMSYRYFCDNNLENKDIVPESVFPEKASIGTLVNINGSGFSKNQLYVWLHNEKNNQYGILWLGTSPYDNNISFKVSKQLCTIATQNINNCVKLMDIVPGKYKIEIRYISTFSGLQITSPSIDFEVLPYSEITVPINTTSSSPIVPIKNMILIH